MKTVFLLSLIGTTLVAAGCAVAPPSRASLDGKYVCNTERMARIDHQAKLDGKDVYWLHCPLAKLRVVG